ncbi:uncharacterized protein B0I36DRAFT_426453 [Microdochium trichocladiopsis]|uniref:Rhodopsin domain-containing protein n=1 Tax=Microdochium trichocladiopsis TaxID=1682393 RepID=A0A9P8YIW8_9PEZI|nr:uncharacterized protein B0I36DRAFT_426453 [Microdochium trichocladiopsis]KAH7039865.1 hypothetical protein B0I36DRAFT_426453 [Microdochium trichocladiopsis]
MSNEVIAATTTSFVFALLAVGLRLYARIALVKKLYGEDYILTSSFVVAMSWWVIKVVGATRNADDGNIRLLAIISWYGTIAWGLCSALTKLSIVYQYWRVFEDIRWVRQLCNILMALLVLYGLYSFLGAILMCIPVSHAWAPLGSPGGSCADPRIYYYLTSSVNIFADVIIFALPVKPVLNLKIPLKQRLALLCCFTFGAFVIICSIVRLYWLVEQMGMKPSRDVVEKVTIWAGIEMMSSIICTCFPVLRPLVMRWFPKLMSGSLGSSARSRISKHLHHHNHAGPPRQKQQQPPVPDQSPKKSQESGSDSNGDYAQRFELDSQQHQQQLQSQAAPKPLTTKSAESRQEQGVAGIPQNVQQHVSWNNRPFENTSQPQGPRHPQFHHNNAGSTGTGSRSLSSPAPPYESRTTSPAPNIVPSGGTMHNNLDQITYPAQVSDQPRPGFMPVSPESTYGSFRASTVSALSHHPGQNGGGNFLYGTRSSRSSGSLRGSLLERMSGSGSGSGPSSSTSTPNLSHLYYTGGVGQHAGVGANSSYYYRASSSSSVYSRYSSSTAAKGFRGLTSGSLSSFGTSTVTSTASGGGTGSTMNTIIDHDDEDDVADVASGRREGLSSADGKMAVGVEDISATLDSAIANLQERSKARNNYNYDNNNNTQSTTALSPLSYSSQSPHDADDRDAGDDSNDDDDDDDDGEEFICHTATYAVGNNNNPWQKRTPSSSKEVLEQPRSPHPASPAVSPIKPTPRLVLPPLFFQPEHAEYEHYRMSVSQPHLPSFMPPTRGLPAIPQTPTRSSLDLEDEYRGKRKSRRSVVSPMGMFEMAA